MPKDFDECVSKGGRVFTKKLGQGRYQHLCQDEKGTHAGHVKQKKLIVRKPNG